MLQPRAEHALAKTTIATFKGAHYPLVAAGSIQTRSYFCFFHRRQGLDGHVRLSLGEGGKFKRPAMRVVVDSGVVTVNEELIVPRRGKKDVPIGPVAIMVAIDNDLPLVLRACGITEAANSRILISNVYFGPGGGNGPTVVGPMVGAPYAVLVLEKLVALGAKKIVFLGWCGSFQDEIRTGDLIIPTAAKVGEGTSPYYGKDATACPSDEVVEAIVRGCRTRDRFHHQGLTWSTDAPYRETRGRVMELQKEGVLGVDMEVSALFSVARFRGVDLGALLMVSDELASLNWKPGFSNERFKKARIDGSTIVAEACNYLKDGNT